MAKDVPDPYPAPDPLVVSSGLALVADGTTPLGAALNWLRAYYGRRDLVCAGFPEIGGDGNGEAFLGCQSLETDTVYPVNPNAAWRIPPVPEMTSVKVVVHAANHPNLDGDVEVTSLVGGDTQTAHIVAAGVTEITLAVDVSGGWDTVEIRTRAHSPGKVLQLWGVEIEADVLSSPLGAGTGSDGFRGVDAAEMEADEGLASDLGIDQLRADLGRIRDTPQTYYQFSTWRPAAAVDAKSVRMNAHPHVAVCPVWVGSWDDAYEVQVHLRAENASGVDTHVVIQAGDRIEPRGQQRAVVTIPALSAEAWYTTTIRLPAGRHVAKGMPPGWESALLCVWPVGSINSDDTAELLQVTLDDMTTAWALLSVSAWGR